MKISLASSLSLSISFLTLTAAHVPYFEPEAFWIRNQSDVPSQLDWSLEHPFELRIDNPLYSPLLGSRAIWSVLGLNDTYDILRVNVSTNQTDPALVVALSALVPACEEYRDFYPSIALLGPSGNPEFSIDALEALPFEAPEGYGALVYNQTHGDREVYADELIPGYGALFPIGINTSCLEAQDCSSGSISGIDLYLPGTYFIVVWDPAQSARDAKPYTFPHDVIINIGVLEEPTEYEQAFQDYVTSYGIGPYMPTVHAPQCTQLTKLQLTGSHI